MKRITQTIADNWEIVIPVFALALTQAALNADGYRTVLQ
jgi:hypothetical protein